MQYEVGLRAAREEDEVDRLQLSRIMEGRVRGAAPFVEPSQGSGMKVRP